MRSGVVIIEGNIGAGKSTFAIALARAIERLGGRSGYILEPDEKSNPFLKFYYNDPARWAYTIQSYLLMKRHRATVTAQCDARVYDKIMILDRSYFGDVCFAMVQKEKGFFTDEEFNAYLELYQDTNGDIHTPQVAIFLHVPVEQCNERIKTRARDCEKSVDPDYLRALQAEIDTLEEYTKTGATKVFSMDWGDAKTPEAIDEVAEKLAREILALDVSVWG